MTRTCIVALVLSLLVFAPARAGEEAPTLVGHWAGTIRVPGTVLEVDVDFTEGKAGTLAGDITIPAQRAKDLPFADVKVDGTKVSFRIAEVPGDPTFTGTLSKDGRKIEGTLSQGGSSFPFTLERAAAGNVKAAAALAGFGGFVESAKEAWKVPGVAVAVVVDDDVVFLGEFGLRNVREKLPVTGDTLFAIGSCTKAFTTFVLGTLADEGRIDWDAPVRDYLPWFRLHDESVAARLTIRDLVTHRSGLPRHDLVWYNNQTLPRADLIRRMAHLPLSAGLREKFQYNNLMYLVAGHVIEVVTGKSWEKCVRERVLEPLGMKNGNFSVADMQRTEDYALPYEEHDDDVVRVDYRPIDVMGPAGSINSSVLEMSNWVRVHLAGGRLVDDRIIRASTLTDLHRPHMVTGGSATRREISASSYAMGWMVDTYRGHRRLQHGGGIDGFTALVTLYPDDGVGMVILANLSGAALPGLVAQHAADRALGLEPIDWNKQALGNRERAIAQAKEAKSKKTLVRKEGTKPAHEFWEYAGIYEHPGYGRISVSADPDGLGLVYNGIVTGLDHWHYEVFSGAEGMKDDTFENTKFLFRTDKSGEVSAVEATFEPNVPDIVFEKRADDRFFDPAYLKRFAGKYRMATQVFTVSLTGSTLTASIPGQPSYTLVPRPGGGFVLKEVKLVRIRFLEDEKGAVTGARIIQPGAVIDAKRL